MTSQPPPKTPHREGGNGGSTKILLGIFIGVVIVLVAAAYLTFSVNVSSDVSGDSLPYETHYNVELPDGEPVTIGNSRISVMAYGDSITTDVDGDREQLVVGQTRVISPHHAKITSLLVPLYDVDFQITLRYLGSTGTKDNFYLTVKTSKQVPEMIIRRLLPSNMNAQPV
ncbi:MAG TPA: hypothetical protein PKM50_08595 [Methanoregula sp.]|nr:hypothetical protein [Methanoregula sp.]